MVLGFEVYGAGFRRIRSHKVHKPWVPALRSRVVRLEDFQVLGTVQGPVHLLWDASTISGYKACGDQVSCKQQAPA